MKLASPVSGVLKQYRDLDSLRSLESFHELRIGVQPGDQITHTVNNLTYPAFVVLMHPCQETVLRDAATVRYLDGTGCYELMS